jgi:hypothetical protein
MVLSTVSRLGLAEFSKPVISDPVKNINSHIARLQNLLINEPYIPTNIERSTVLLTGLRDILTNRESVSDSQKKQELESFLNTDFKEKGITLFTQLEDTYNQRNQSFAAMGFPSGFLENYAAQYNNFKAPFQKFLDITEHRSLTPNIIKDSSKVEKILEEIYSSANIDTAEEKLRNFIINTLSEQGFQGFSFSLSHGLTNHRPGGRDQDILEAFKPKETSHPNSTNLSQAFATTVKEIFEKPLIKPSDFSRFKQAYESCIEAISNIC